jgi:hypothetical protein
MIEHQPQKDDLNPYPWYDTTCGTCYSVIATGMPESIVDELEAVQIEVEQLMAYSVAQCAQEIAIRLALGAESSHIRNMVVFQGLRSALAGVVCGLAAAFGLTRLIASFLFGVKAWDPPSLFCGFR